jgi:hypothetical protein
LSLVAPRQIFTKEIDLSADPGSSAIEQAEYGQSQGAFTRSALTYKAHNFARQNFDKGAS